jgi:hypothetical protein
LALCADARAAAVYFTTLVAMSPPEIDFDYDVRRHRNRHGI